MRRVNRLGDVCSCKKVIKDGIGFLMRPGLPPTDNAEGHGLQKPDHKVAEVDQDFVLGQSDDNVGQDHGDSEQEHDLSPSQERIGEAQNNGSHAVAHTYQGC